MDESFPYCGTRKSLCYVNLLKLKDFLEMRLSDCFLKSRDSAGAFPTPFLFLFLLLPHRLTSTCLFWHYNKLNALRTKVFKPQILQFAWGRQHEQKRSNIPLISWSWCPFSFSKLPSTCNSLPSRKMFRTQSSQSLCFGHSLSFSIALKGEQYSSGQIQEIMLQKYIPPG